MDAERVLERARAINESNRQFDVLCEEAETNIQVTHPKRACFNISDTDNV